MKKRKLNSKNPKYLTHIEEDDSRKRILVQTAENFKVYAVYLED